MPYYLFISQFTTRNFMCGWWWLVAENSELIFERAVITIVTNGCRHIHDLEAIDINANMEMAQYVPFVSGPANNNNY